MSTTPVYRKEAVWWKRWLRRLAIAVLLVTAYFVIEQVIARQQARQKLTQAVAELDEKDPGWRLADLEAARAEVPERENSARVVVAARAQLPANWPAVELLTALDEVAAERQLPPDLSARLDKELKAVAAALELATPLEGMPRGRHRLEYRRNPMTTLLNDQQKTRDITTLLRFAALQHAQANQASAALRSLLAGLNAARSIGDEPLAISQLIRTACVTVVCHTTQRVLAQTQPAAADLERLQRALSEEDAFAGTAIVARGERAAMHEVIDAIESGEESLSSLANGGGRVSWQERFFWPVILTRFLDEHSGFLRLMTRQVEDASAPLHEQAEREQALQEELEALPKTAILTRLLMPAYARINESFRRKHASLRSVIILLACERYRLAQGRWPADLKALVPTYLKEVPLDPFAGKPMRYQITAQGVLAYSTSVDGSDDGGAIDCKDPRQPGCDQGYRLWNPASRRQAARK